MNRRGLSIDNINSKYRGASFVGSPIISQDRFPTAASPISMVGSPVARSFSPVSYVQPINSLAAPTSIITQPLLRRSVVRTPAPITIIQQAPTSVVIQEPTTTTVVEQGGLVPISKKVETIRETTVPTHQVQEEGIRQRVGVNETSGFRYPKPLGHKSRCHCPWWLWLLLLLPLLGLLLFGLSKFFGGQQTSTRSQNTETTQEQSNNTVNTVVVDAGKCSAGFFFHNGNCMKCPAGSGWNTTHCVMKKVITTQTSKSMEIDPVPSDSYGSTLKSGSLSSNSNLFSQQRQSTASSSSTSSQQSGSLTGSKTIGEEMKKLGLDYESFRKKTDAAGGIASLEGRIPGQLEGDVVAPIFNRASHHLRHLNKH